MSGMAGAVLSPADRAYFLAMLRRQTNSAVHRRMNALLPLDDGWTAGRVAEALFIEAETVREHSRLYTADGRAGVERLAYAGHAPLLTEAQNAALVAELSARLYMTAKAVCGFVADRFGVAYTPHAMAKLLGRMGFVWKRPKCIPAEAEADAAAQRAFLETTLAPLMAAAEADPARPLYFVDATHPAYDAHPACGWIRRGETRTLKSNHGRVNVTMNGALSWPGREVVTREADRITGAEMIALFQDLAARHPQAEAISAVVDNATYNRAASVREWLAAEGVPRQAGLPAALRSQPQSDRAAVMVLQEKDAVECSLPHACRLQDRHPQLLQQPDAVEGRPRLPHHQPIPPHRGVAKADSNRDEVYQE
ncbi:IS630 family transposase [Roseomonas chloroacetimidivorans]|uniref:IS630 family transposase n=1 Tax=Roseomonas chloroacetimidivorans TaxID=1766656 RepID=UPI003C77E002